MMDENETEIAEAVETPEAVETEDETHKEIRKLRKEAETLRARAKSAEANATRTDELAHRLHTELVRATGKLADPSDLEFNAEHLDDSDKLAAAIESLTAAKPHLRSRAPKGDVGQGNRGPADEPANLLQILKSVV